jgi:hypothetical protein
MIEDQGQAERLGLSREEFNAYAETVRKARDQAKEDLFDEYMDEYGERQSDWYAARQNEVRQKSRAKSTGSGTIMVLSFLKDGTRAGWLSVTGWSHRTKARRRRPRGALRQTQRLDGDESNSGTRISIEGKAGSIRTRRRGYFRTTRSGDEMVQALLKLRPMNELDRSGNDGPDAADPTETCSRTEPRRRKLEMQ